MANTPLIYLLVLISLLWLCILPAFVVWIHKIFCVRTVLFMKKRYIDGSLYICAFASYWLFVDRPLSLFESYLSVSGHAGKPWFFTFQCLMKLSYPFCAQGVVYAQLYRFWMIYFDFIYSESLDNQHWKIQINPQGSSHSSAKEQWIIHHRKDYGHPKWIFKRLAFIYIIVASFTASLRELAQWEIIQWGTANTIDSALYLMPLISTFVLWFKMPSFLDSFMVKDELKWMIMVSSVGLMMNIVAIIILSTLMVDASAFWAEIVYLVTPVFVCVLWVFIQTQYIVHRVRNNADYFRNILATGDEYKQSADLSQSSPSPIYRKTGSSSVVTKPTNAKHTLCDILQDKITFNLFVRHITTELSTECIFSFIEFTQFQMLLRSDEQFMENVTIKSKTKNKDSYDKIVLLDDETIPLSHIVYVQEYEDVQSKVDRYKRVVISLAEKYIYDSGVFCININYNTRLDIIEWINTYCYHKDKEFTAEQYGEMYYLFEKCRREMYKLMQHTLTRFVKTKQFQLYSE
eukprot:148783_1